MKKQFNELKNKFIQNNFEKKIKRNFLQMNDNSLQKIQDPPNIKNYKIKENSVKKFQNYQTKKKKDFIYESKSKGNSSNPKKM